MKIKEIMTSDVITVSPETKVTDVSDILTSNHFHGIPVVEDEKVVGIITESDFFLKKYDDIYFPTYIKFLEENNLAEHLPDNLREKIETLSEAKARDIMTENPWVFSAEDSVSVFMDKVKGTKFTTFPVVDADGKITGIVTLADYLGTMKKNSQRMKNHLKTGYDRNIDRVTEDLEDLWRKNVVILSKKKIRTWKGVAFLGFAAVFLLAVSFIVIAKNQLTNQTESGEYIPMECQKYAYGPWGECDAEGFQSREITERFPQNCSGGLIPDQIQPCNR